MPISQSGETADTMAGLRIAKEMGAPVLSICNVVGSTITREAHGTIYTHAGPEIGVASTKAFTAQLTALYLLGLYLAQIKKTLSAHAGQKMINNLLQVPSLIKRQIEAWQKIAGKLADLFYDKKNFLYLGRHLNFPIALEGALKLKEISYIHAEGYAAGEMKHGPIALIDKHTPTVALVAKDHVYEKMISNIEEVRSRRGTVIVVGEKEDKNLSALTPYLIPVSSLPSPDLAPFIYTVPLQLLAYEIAVARGCDVDQPRNLAKSVTVE